MIERFADEENGGFFETSADHEQLVARRKDLEDHPIPSGNASAALGLLRLAALTRRARVRAPRRCRCCGCCTSSRPSTPQAFAHLLQALDFHLSPTREVALVGDGHARRSSAWCAGVPARRRAGRRRARRRAAAPGPPPGGRPGRRLRLRALRLQGAGDRARGARTAALLTLLGPAPRPVDAHSVAARIADLGTAARGERRRGTRPPLHGAHLPRGAGLRVAVQRFAVPGRGRSRNVIGVLDTPRTLPADRDGPHRLGPGRARRQRQRLRPRRAGRAGAAGCRRIGPGCDVWLVATGAEERLYTGSPDHLGALALARRARARGGRKRLRFALSLDEVGRDRPFWLRSPAGSPRPAGGGRAAARRPRAHACPCAGCATRAPATPTTASSSCSACPAAKLGVGAGGEPCRHLPCDRPRRLDPRSLRLARRLTEAALLPR